MSHGGGSSMMSSENPEVKYKKALKEISKLINANKVIREQSEELRRSMENQMNEVAIRYNDLEKDYLELKKEHQSMEKYLEEMQESHSELQREHHTVQKELAYLNEMLAQQNVQLKKVQAIKDQKKISQLIRTYQEKQQLYSVQRGSHEELIKKLNEQLTTLEFEVSQERALREQTQDKFELMRGQINQYRQLNTLLIKKNQMAYGQFYNKEGATRQKEKELQSLMQDLRRQISSLKTAKQLATEKMGAQYQSNYELILQQKNKILAEYVQLKQQYQVAQNKIRSMYDLQERMNVSVVRAEALSEECNMLKSKIVVLELRDMDEGIDFEFDNKEFDDKVTYLLSQHDPLDSIKNSDPTSHFKILKAHIVELRERLEKVHSQRKEYTKKYKSISSKFSKLQDKSTRYEEQNKLLLGKVEGFEKLTEKLQNELKRSIMIHESQVNKMTSTTNQMLTRKNQQLQTSMRFMREQIQQVQSRSTKTQKNLLQQIESLKLEATTLTIRSQELQEKLHETNQFITIYKNKLNDLTQAYQQTDDKNTQLNQELIKYQQLYKDQKAKTQSLANYKTQLTKKLNESQEDLDRRVASYDQNIRLNNDSFEGQLKKYKDQKTRLQEEVNNLKKELVINKREYDEKKYRQLNEIQQLKKELSYFRDIESQYEVEKQKNRELQTHNETLKIKDSKYNSQHEKATHFEEQLMRVTDQCNDLTRKLIDVEGAFNVTQNDLRDMKSSNESFRKQNAQMRMKLLQNGQLIRKEFDTKDQDARQSILRLNEEISELNLQLNQQKSKNSRLNTDYHRFKVQKQRLEQFCDEMRDKDNKNIDNINSLRTRIQQSIEEFEKSKAQNRMLQLSLKRLNDELDNLQTSYNSLRQEHSGLRMKQQESENIKNEIVRELQSLRFYFPDVEELVKKLRIQTGLSWEDQKGRDNIHQIIMRIKRILKTGQNLDSRTNLGSAAGSYTLNMAGTNSFSNIGSRTNILTSTATVHKTYTTDNMVLATDSPDPHYRYGTGVGESAAEYTQKDFFNTYVDPPTYQHTANL